MKKLLLYLIQIQKLILVKVIKNKKIDQYFAQNRCSCQDQARSKSFLYNIAKICCIKSFRPESLFHCSPMK